MPIRIDSRSADFASRFKAFLATKREVSADIEAATRAIVDDVKARGDAALIEATRKFDRLTRRCRAACGSRRPRSTPRSGPAIRRRSMR